MATSPRRHRRRRILRAARALRRCPLVAGVVAAGCLSSPKPVPLPAVPPEADVGLAAAPADPVEAWRADVGNGLEYGITVSGPVFFAATTNRVLVAHATEDGRRFWGRRYGSPLVGSPVRAGERLYFGTGYRDRRVHALDVALGRGAWDKRVGEVRTAPVVQGDTLFVTTEDGRVQALAAGDGRFLWERALGDKAAWPPVPHGDVLLVATYRDTLYALQRATGEVRARLPLPGTPSAPPLVAADTLFLPLHPGRLAAVVLREGAAPTLLRALALGDAPVLAAPVRGPAGALLLLDRSGTVWRADGAAPARPLVELGGAATGALAAAAQGALVGRLDGALFLVDLDGAVRWRRELGDAMVSPPSVRRDGVLVPLLHGEVVKLR